MPAQAPSYPAYPFTAHAAISTANTDRTGATGTVAAVYTAPGVAGAARGAGLGAVVEGIRVVATGTTTVGVIRLYRSDGTTLYLVQEILVTAIVPSTTVKSWQIPTTAGADTTGFLPLNLKLRPGEILRVATHNAEAFHVSAEIGMYE